MRKITSIRIKRGEFKNNVEIKLSFDVNEKLLDKLSKDTKDAEDFFKRLIWYTSESIHSATW